MRFAKKASLLFSAWLLGVVAVARPGNQIPATDPKAAQGPLPNGWSLPLLGDRPPDARWSPAENPAVADNGQGRPTSQSVGKKAPGKLTGEVRDSTNNEVLIGAIVSVNNLRQVQQTDVNGRFEMVLEPGSYQVSFSYVGFSPVVKEVQIREDGAATLNVRMAPAKTYLNEIVVIGYGRQKKRDVTGAVSSVSSQDIGEIPVTNPIQALKGKAAGVDVFNGGNEPGSAINILIRGERSIGADNRPLVVLDGIPIIDGFNEINPNDIASVEVLKDASAAAIYGSRASNGVVLLTTKRGSAGKTRIAYDGYYGLTSVINKLDLMNGEQFAQLRREANRTVTANGSYPDDTRIFDNIGLESIAQGRSTDWQDFTYQSGYRQNHQLSLNGGGEKTRFAASVNYFDEKGIVGNSAYNRASFRINLDHEANDKIKFGLSSFGSRSKQQLTQNDLFDNVLRLNPLGVPYDEEGNIRFRPTNDESQRVNPLSDIANSLNEQFKTRVFASLFGEYQITRDLSYRLNVGPDAQFVNTGYFYGTNTTNTQGGSSAAGVDNANTLSLTVENILNFNKNFGDNHSLSTTLVQSYQNQVIRADRTSVRRLPYDSQTYNNLGSAGEISGVGTNYQQWTLLSYTARINYQYKDRYLLTVTGRADGSSRFAEGNKWGFFPSAALAWRISDEPLLKTAATISDLKLRLSYGETGNTGIQPYQTFSKLSSSSYVFGTSGAPGFLPGSISNPSLRWETTKQFNVGLDFGVWNNRVVGAIDYYVSNTTDLLLPRSIPSSTGFTSVLENIGSTRNKGLELAVSTNNFISTDGFQWKTDFNFSRNRNKITELFGNGKDDVGNGWFIGKPINVFYDYRKIGIWQTDEAENAQKFGFSPGIIKIEDANQDGKYDANDRVILGSPSPGWTGGMTNRFSYRGLEFSIVLHTRQNYLTNSQWYENNNRLAGRYNNLDVNYWTPENPTNDNPRPNVSQESVFLGSTLAYKDVSFVRVRNMALSYALSDNLVKRLRLTGLRITLTGENPFTFTAYQGLDPEFESNGERALYPSTKMYLVGLNATF
ncbi:MAG: TonB-dependent receptor [Ferruginibacter sp.]|nr:TonB-dependent receptor [Cytophagales bacterium]